MVAPIKQIITIQEIVETVVLVAIMVELHKAIHKQTQINQVKILYLKFIKIMVLNN